MANIGSKGIARYVDLFATDSVAGGAAAGVGSAADGIAWLGSSYAGDTPFARAVAAARGLHVTGATDTTDNDMVEFVGDTLMFFGQAGFSAAEILVQFDVVSTLAFNFGLNDTVLEGNGSAGSLPVELSGTTWTSNATDFVGIVYDVDADNDDLHCFWVDDGSDTSETIANLRMTGMAPTASQWLWMRVEIQDRGSGNGVRAKFIAVDHNGKSVEKVFNTTLDRDVGLCYYFAFENRSGVAHTCYIKFPAWEQGNN